MSLDELRRRCVDAFPGSPTRSQIFGALEGLATFLCSNTVRCEIWIDGSFITEKPDPEDADITVVVDVDVFEALNVAFQNQLQRQLDHKNYDPLLHNFLEIRFPRGDPRRHLWESAQSEWAKWWAVGEKTLFLRGMPIISLGESDVGHRLLHK
jgi:hypothetical protein